MAVRASARPVMSKRQNRSKARPSTVSDVRNVAVVAPADADAGGAGLGHAPQVVGEEVQPFVDGESGGHERRLLGRREGAG